MPRSKLGELQLKLLVERVQARTTAQQDISDDAAAVPVKKKRGPQAVRGAGPEQGGPVARHLRPADAPPCPENCHDGGCAACMPILNDRQQLNCILCFDAWLARREELRHLPPQVGEILKFRRLWDGINPSDRNAIVLVWDDVARTCEHAFPPHHYAPPPRRSRFLCRCARSRIHTYARSDARKQIGWALGGASILLITIPISKFAGVIKEKRSACKDEFACELIKLG